MINTNEGMEPMLSSCANLVTHICKEDSCRLSELLSLFNDFRPCLRAKEGSVPLIVELLDWDDRSAAKPRVQNKGDNIARHSLA